MFLPRVAGEHHEAHGEVFFGGGVGDGAERFGFGVSEAELGHGRFPVALGSLTSRVLIRLCLAHSVFRIQNPQGFLRILP